LIADHFPEYVSGTCLCGWDAPSLASWSAHLAEQIDVEHLVVPRSEVSTEYGVQYGSFVHGDVVSAEAARRRAVEVFEYPPDAARQRLVWTGPWSPLPEDAEDGGCGYEWDHTIRVGENVCQECGAEIIDD
jgi:hypothetical protein